MSSKRKLHFKIVNVTVNYMNSKQFKKELNKLNEKKLDNFDVQINN